MSFGNKLQQLRKTNGMSQEQLASQIPVSRQAISKWELGESTPDIENIIQISKIFGVSTDYLLKEEEEAEGAVTLKVEGKKEEETVKILYIASVAAFAIGLLLAFGGWDKDKPMEAIFGGMIVQVVGIVAYFIGKSMGKAKPQVSIPIITIALGGFMPVSILISLILGRTIAPYPTDVLSCAVFLIVYVIFVALFSLIMKKVRIKR